MAGSPVRDGRAPADFLAQTYCGCVGPSRKARADARRSAGAAHARDDGSARLASRKRWLRAGVTAPRRAHARRRIRRA
jgi:hypothetical protein